MKSILIVVVLLLVTGCTSGVTLLNPRTGSVVKCGPFLMRWGLGLEEQESCSYDYQMQGYRRIPN